MAEPDVKLPMLTVGTQVYKNVTVTTRAKEYVFVLHSKGMTNIKVSELSAETREQLGYPAANDKAGTNAWSSQVLQKLENTKQLQGLLPVKNGKPALQLDRNFMILVAAVALLFYLGWSYCCMLICKKAGSPGGALVWIPVLQIIALLRAAQMSKWWFVASLVPILNLIAQITWSVRISQIRGKGALCILGLVMPLTHPFAMMYLAFSANPPAKPRKPQVEIMTLETA